MRTRDAWKQLGINPCDDVQAVRRAYAARLKQIDPDSEIAVFENLRRARALAISDAELRKSRGRGTAEDETTSDDDELDELDEVERCWAEQNEALGVPEPVAASDPEDRSGPYWHDSGLASEAPSKASQDNAHRKHMQTVEQNLYASPFTPAADERACRALKSILASERMEELDFAERIGVWLGNLLIETAPNSDNAVRIAVRYFGWREEAELAAASWHARSIGQRAADIDCVKALSDQAHHWHEAYEALKDGPPGKRSLGDQYRLQPLV
ncbi:MAG: hypothetical protein AAGK02_13120, partial [Pseudomonadota bacterium]